MKGVSVTEEQLIAGIRERDNHTIRLVYRTYYPVIRTLVLRNSGSEQDAEDLFQDGMVIIFNKIKQEGLVLQCSFKTYLYSVCKHLWLRKLKAMSSLTTITIDPSVDPEEPQFEEEQIRELLKFSVLQRLLLELGEDCRRILEQFYRKVSLADIAENMGFSSADYVKFRKYQCKERLKKRIVTDPVLKALFVPGG